MNNLPPTTPQQQTILKHLYAYRFLNRTHIQALLNHKDKRRIISWLKDLREKQYIDWRYDATNFITKSQPAIYYLSLNGIRYLRQLNMHPTEELRKRYKEPTRSQSYIDQCIFIADSCIELKAKNDHVSQYSCVLTADYADPNSSYHYLDDLKPHLLFSKQQGEMVTSYLLEYLSPTLPRYQLRKRIKDYIEYLDDDWGKENGPGPIVLFVCQSIADLLYVKRRAKMLLDELASDENLHIRVTTIDKIRISGVASMIWEEV